MAWSADSARLYLTLGPDLYSAAPADTTTGGPVRTVALSAPADVPGGSIAFTNARILPMTGEDTVIARGTVVVEGSVPMPANAKVVDLGGRTLMPSFFDAHSHIDCCYGTSAMPQKHPTRYAALAYGITTNFDPYANELPSYETREMTIAGKMVGPRWLTTGNAIYGRAGKPDRVFNRMERLEDARAIARRKAAITDRAILKSYKLTTARRSSDFSRPPPKTARWWMPRAPATSMTMSA